MSIGKVRSGLMAISDRLRAGKKANDQVPATFRAAIPIMNPRYRFYRHNSELIEVLDLFVNAAWDVTSYVELMPEEIQERLDPGNVALGQLWDIPGGADWWREHGDGKVPLVNPNTGKVAWRLIVTFPPRHGKSETVSCLFTAYYVMRHPDRWVSLCSYGADLVYKLSKIARTYYLRLGGRRDAAMFQVKQWGTSDGGGLWATGRGGSGTGKGWHLGVCDDMLKDAKEASSALIRSRLKDWAQSVFYTRSEPPSLEIQVSTRWHADDVIGWQLEEERALLEDGEGEGWYVVHFAAEGEERSVVEDYYPANCAVHPDWRAVGEALWTEKYPIEKLRRILRRIGQFFYSALYLQRPTPRGGDLWKVSQIEIVRAVPPGLSSVRAWDIAYTKRDHLEQANTVGIKLEGPCREGFYYIVDMKRFAEGSGSRNKIIRQSAMLDGTRTTIRIPEDPAGGIEVSASIVAVLAGFIVKRRKATGDKALQADPAAAQMEIGRFRMLQAPWNKTLMDELGQLPHGALWDVSDALAAAFDELVNYGATSGSVTGGTRPSTGGVR